MKNKTLINWNFEGWALQFLKEYIDNYGELSSLYDGKSRRKVYSAPNTDYQVVCWQTKKHIYCEVVR